jgi:hypothetical protein
MKRALIRLSFAGLIVAVAVSSGAVRAQPPENPAVPGGKSPGERSPGEGSPGDRPPGKSQNRRPEGGQRGNNSRQPLEIVLDKNHDNVISAEELEGAVAALKKLDKNGDGKLTPDEYRPPRPQGNAPSPGQGPEGSPGQGRRPPPPGDSESRRYPPSNSEGRRPPPPTQGND